MLVAGVCHRGVAGGPSAAPFDTFSHRSSSTVRRASRASLAVRPMALFGGKGSDKENAVKVDDKTGVAKGMKWDGANLRWVKKEGAYFNTVVTPKSGAAYTVWPIVHTYLTEKKLKSIPAGEAAKEIQSGKAILVDIRDPINFEKEHVEGSINVPLFRAVQGNSPFDVAKKVVMAGFAMAATERNPDFAAEALQKLPKNKKLIVACSIGGTLVTTRTATSARKGMEKKVYADPERAFGRESRSLKGCYELYQAGFKNVAHLEGGVQQWRYQGFPMSRK